MQTEPISKITNEKKDKASVAKCQINLQIFKKKAQLLPLVILLPVSLFREKKLRGLKDNLKHKIPSLVDLCGFVSLRTKRFPILASKLCTHIFLTLWEIYPTLENVNSKREDSKVKHII